MEIVLNKKYKLVPLISVKKDDISKLFENKRGVFVCNYPELEWYKTNGFTRAVNYSIEKKAKFFELMNKNAVLLSITQDSKIKRGTKNFRLGRHIHFGSSFYGRAAQVVLALKLLFWLVRNYKSYDYILCYNFYPAEFFASSMLKFFCNKTLIVDFEDDYLIQSTSRWYKYYFNLIKNIPDKVICINERMIKYFNSYKTLVFNGFIDLSYVSNFQLNKNQKINFLFSGALDEIRGVDLIPDLVKALKNNNYTFNIDITGGGILEQKVRNWEIPEVNYLGFLDADKYKEVIKGADVCLVLQKPDHPFSQGSFPSKVEYYADQKKPILHVELC
jgi:glycosyltransferase involved in cell wall biosynthesis